MYTTPDPATTPDTLLGQIRADPSDATVRALLQQLDELEQAHALLPAGPMADALGSVSHGAREVLLHCRNSSANLANPL